MSLLSSKKFLGLAVAVAICGLIGVIPQAKAADQLTFCISDLNPTLNGSCTAGDSILLSSNGSTFTTSTVTGSASIVGDAQAPDFITGTFNVGAFTMSVDTGRMHFSATNALDLGFNVVTAAGTTGTHSLWIEFNGDPFISGAPFAGSGAVTEDPNVIDTFTGCYQPGSGLGGWCVPFGTPIGSHVFPTTGAGGFTNSLLPATNPFGLGIELEVDVIGQGGSTGDLALIPTPEPTSILLLGGVLVIAGRTLRKKYQKAA
jgi:hypothetical protein